MYVGQLRSKDAIWCDSPKLGALGYSEQPCARLECECAEIGTERALDLAPDPRFNNRNISDAHRCAHVSTYPARQGRPRLVCPNILDGDQIAVSPPLDR